MCSKPSCLGEPWCSEWGCCDCPGPSSPKKSRLEDSNPVRAKQDWFKAPHSPTTMAKICQGYMPQNTAKSTSWGLRVFRAWRDHRNKSVAEQCPADLLEVPTVEHLNYWLSHFVVEARREDGQPYPPGSINNILSGLYRYSKSCAPTGVECPNF